MAELDPINPLAQVQALMKGELDPAREAQSGALSRLKAAHEGNIELNANDDAGRWGAIAAGFASPAANFGQALAQAGGAYGKELSRQFDIDRTNKTKAADLEFQDASRRLTGLETKYMGALSNQGKLSNQSMWSPVPGEPGMLFNRLTSERKYVAPSIEAQAEKTYNNALKQAMLLDPANALQYASDARDAVYAQGMAAKPQAGATLQTQVGVAPGTPQAKVEQTPSDLTTAQWVQKLRDEGMNEDADALEKANPVPAPTPIPTMPTLVDKRPQLVADKAAARIAAEGTPEALDLLKKKAEIKAASSSFQGTLSPEQNDALFGPNGLVTRGDLPLSRINARNARIYAEGELKSPGTPWASKGADIKAMEMGVNRFDTGKQGDMVRSFDVAIDHLDTLLEAGAALQNGDVRKYNELTNWYERETGNPAQPSFEAVKRIVSDEIVKAVIGGAGALGDREEAQKTLDAANSPEALRAVVEKYHKLMTGQLGGLKTQYERTTKRNDFLAPKVFLSPRSIEVAKKYKPDLFAAKPASSQAPATVTSGLTPEARRARIAELQASLKEGKQ